jgi:hypothetical protein
MSCRVVTVACALLLGGGACGGDPFEAVNRNDEGGVDSDAGPRDSTLTDLADVSTDVAPPDTTLIDAGDVANDAGPRDSTLTDLADVSTDVAPRDVGTDDAPRDSTLPDVTSIDSLETGVVVDVTLPPDGAAGDARQDVPTEAAAPDAGDGSTAWCAGRWALFCADFDTVTAVSDGWTTASVTPGAVLDFNLVDFTSPRRSMHAKLPVSSGGSEMDFARLIKVVSTSLSRSILEFDCNVASIGTAPGDWLLQISRLGRNATESGVALLAMPMDRWSVLVATSQLVFSGELPAPPKYGSFVRVSMDVVWSATAGSVTISFDGITVLAKDGIATALATPTSSVDVTVGLSEVVGPTPPAELSIDNVVLR